MIASLKTKLNELNTILEQERACILRGDYLSIASLLTQKEEILQSLRGRISPEDAWLKKIEGKIRRNTALLRNAADGFREAQQRLAASRLSRMSLETYDASCQRHTRCMVQNLDLEKRA